MTRRRDRKDQGKTHINGLWNGNNEDGLDLEQEYEGNLPTTSLHYISKEQTDRAYTSSEQKGTDLPNVGEKHPREPFPREGEGRGVQWPMGRWAGRQAHAPTPNGWQKRRLRYFGV